MPRILEVKNLSVVLEGKTIIEKLNLDLDEGENLAIIGPNGSGKTVFLKTLLNTLPYKGNIFWGKDVRIGYVPQKIDADRHLPLNMLDLFESKTKILNLPHSAIEETCKTLDLGLEILKTPVGHLSGGQFQRSLIGFALLGKPNVMLFDEPTASLDQPREEQVYELIHRLQDQFGITIILVSHDLSLVNRYSTKVLCLNKQNICFGPPQEALTPETLQKLYGAPYKYYHHIHEEHA